MLQRLQGPVPSSAGCECKNAPDDETRSAARADETIDADAESDEHNSGEKADEE